MRPTPQAPETPDIRLLIWIDAASRSCCDAVGKAGRACYARCMKKRGSPVNRRRPAGRGLTLGRAWSEKISAVEGIKLSASAKRRAAEFDRLGLSPEERVRRIVSVHRKG